ncbi:MAG: VOC family protein [Caldilineaceae bacterium]
MPFLAVSNLAASVRYYVDGLGFSMTQQWVDNDKLRWCHLQQGGVGLMLQEFATKGHDSWTPAGKVGEGVTLYFICTDALAIYDAIRAKQIAATEPIVSNGLWLTTLIDPDGYQPAFESKTDVPEGSRLSMVQ